jgi:hypothetical protein
MMEVWARENQCEIFENFNAVVESFEENKEYAEEVDKDILCVCRRL